MSFAEVAEPDNPDVGWGIYGDLLIPIRRYVKGLRSRLAAVEKKAGDDASVLATELNAAREYIVAVEQQNTQLRRVLEEIEHGSAEAWTIEKARAARSSEERCPSKWGRKYACTKNAGHEGDHTVEALNGPGFSWPQIPIPTRAEEPKT